VVLLEYGHPISLIPERVSITATLIGSSEAVSPARPGAVRLLVPGPPRANPHGLSTSPMGPAQPGATGGPIAYSALLAVFPHTPRSDHQSNLHVFIYNCLAALLV
jgi:hypothetical protein